MTIIMMIAIMMLTGLKLNNHNDDDENVFKSNFSENVSKKESANRSYQSVADFYSGKSVFLTGGTGFTGKVIIEKLLYSCNKLDKIYMLIRDKKGENANKRLKSIFEGPLYERLRKSNPDFIKKIVPVVGNFEEPNLGINDKDEQTLINDVSVVLHVGAKIKFNRALSETIKANFESTRYIVDLSHRIKNLQSLVYTSTAFAHPHSKTLTETLYPPPAKVDDVYNFIEEHDGDEKATSKFLNSKPNTYIFGKSLSESYVGRNCKGIPTVIVRPSSIIATKDEPLKGWMDNWQLTSIFFYGITMGWNRVILGKRDNVMDFIPVDYVANLVIAGATRAKNNEVQIFNSTTSAENPVTWGETLDFFIQEIVKQNKNILPYPGVYYTNSKLMAKLITRLFQITPAQLADLWLRIRGMKPKYVKIMGDVLTARNFADYYTYNTWVMKADNVRALYKSLSPEDKKSFPFDPAEIDWHQYLADFYKGSLKYIYKR